MKLKTPSGYRLTSSRIKQQFPFKTTLSENKQIQKKGNNVSKELQTKDKNIILTC